MYATHRIGSASAATTYRYVPTINPASRRRGSSRSTFSCESYASRAAPNARRRPPSTVAAYECPKPNRRAELILSVGVAGISRQPRARQRDRPVEGIVKRRGGLGRRRGKLDGLARDLPQIAVHRQRSTGEGDAHPQCARETAIGAGILGVGGNGLPQRRDRPLMVQAVQLHRSPGLEQLGFAIGKGGGRGNQGERQVSGADDEAKGATAHAHILRRARRLRPLVTSAYNPPTNPHDHDTFREGVGVGTCGGPRQTNARARARPCP